jgi:DNA-binding GntR family transcriptional regulator
MSAPRKKRSPVKRPKRTADSLKRYLVDSPGRGSTADAVTDALREAILDGRIPSNTWLREEDLASQLNLSRTPIREAIGRLTTEGLAVRVPNQGTQVTGMAIEDILAVYAVRESLEGLAARLAAQRVTPVLVDALTNAHKRFADESGLDGAPSLAAANLEFHRLIREASDNTYLERFLTLVEHAVRRFGRSTFENSERVQQTIEEHQALLDAIRGGRADDAEALAKAHMRNAREARLAAFLDANS